MMEPATSAGMKSGSQFIVAIDTFPATSRAIHDAARFWLGSCMSYEASAQKLRSAYRALSASGVMPLRVYGVRRTNHAEI